MRDIGVALLRLDTDEEKARVQSLKDAKKSEAEAEEAGTEEAGKSGRDKIIAQLATVQLIMQGDDDPQYPVLDLQLALGAVLELLG